MLKHKTKHKKKNTRLTLKKWILYHGTGEREHKQIKKGGLRPMKHHFVSLTTKKSIATKYAKEQTRYSSKDKKVRRKPIVYRVTLTENDFKSMRRSGVSKQVVDTRRRNLNKAVKERWDEYEWYGKIPKNRLKRV